MCHTDTTNAIQSKQSITYRQDAIKVTYKYNICVIEDQLSGRVPDKPLELKTLTSIALSN